MGALDDLLKDPRIGSGAPVQVLPGSPPLKPLDALQGLIPQRLEARKTKEREARGVKLKGELETAKQESEKQARFLRRTEPITGAISDTGKLITTTGQRAGEAIKETAGAVGSFAKFTAGIPSAVANFFTRNEQRFGQTLGEAAAVGLPGANKPFQEATASQEKLDALTDTLGQAIVAGKKLGKDTSSMERIYQQNTGSRLDIGSIVPSANKTAKQIYGEGLGVITDIAAFGTYGTAAKGAKTGQFFSHAQLAANLTPTVQKTALQAFMQGAKKEAPLGAAIGAGFGTSESLQRNKPTLEVVQDSAVSALIGGFFSAAVGGLIGVRNFKLTQRQISTFSHNLGVPVDPKQSANIRKQIADQIGRAEATSAEISAGARPELAAKINAVDLSKAKTVGDVVEAITKVTGVDDPQVVQAVTRWATTEQMTGAMAYAKHLGMKPKDALAFAERVAQETQQQLATSGSAMLTGQKLNPRIISESVTDITRQFERAGIKVPKALQRIDVGQINSWDDLSQQLVTAVKDNPQAADIITKTIGLRQRIITSAPEVAAATAGPIMVPRGSGAVAAPGSAPAVEQALRIAPQQAGVAARAAPSVGGLPIPLIPPGQTLTHLIARNAQEVALNLRAQAQAGFARLPGKIISGEERTIPIVQEAIKEVLDAGRKRNPSLIGRMTDLAEGFMRNVRKFQFEGELRKYGTTYAQLTDDIRTGLIPIGRRSYEQAEVAVNGIIGDMPQAEINTMFDVLFLRDFKTRITAGQKVSGDLTLPQVNQELARLEANLSPRLTQRIAKTKEMLDTVRQDLIQRGKLDTEQNLEDYIPHYVVDYLPEWWSGQSAYLGSRLRSPYRAYTKQATGSARQVVTSPEAIQSHLTAVFMDNQIDDWALAQLEKQHTANFTAFQKTASADEIVKIFGEDGSPKPGRRYTFNGKEYEGFQYNPGRVIYPGHLDDTPPDATVGVLGRYRKTYLVEKPVAERFKNLKSPAGDIPFLYDTINATQVWKRVTLNTAGLPYQFNNLFGDAINGLYRQAPGSVKNVPEAISLLWKLKTNTPMNQRETELWQFLESKDVVHSGFVRSFLRNPKFKAANPLTVIEEASDFREQILRATLGIHYYDQAKAGLPLQAKGINIAGLDPASAAAKISRESVVDYLAASPAARRFLGGLVTPFYKFHVENLKNFARYAKAEPAEFTAKFIAPYVAAWGYNNTGYRKEIEENLPQYMRDQAHLIVNGYDTNGDGKPDKALVWGYQTPLDLAMSWIATNEIGSLVTDVRAGRINPQEAAGSYLTKLGLAPVRQVSTLTNPVIQAWQGLLQNKDPFTGRTIVPERLVGTSEEKRLIAAYLVEKTALPVMQYASSRKQAEPTQLSGIGGDVERWLFNGPLDVQRALGVYSVSLSGGRWELRQSEEAKINGLRNQLLWEVEHTYVSSPNQLAEKIKEVTEQGREGVRLSGREVGSRLTAPRVLIDKLKEDLLTITDQDTRNQYESSIEVLRQLQEGKRIESLPKSVRLPYLIDLINRNLLQGGLPPLKVSEPGKPSSSGFRAIAFAGDPRTLLAQSSGQRRLIGSPTGQGKNVGKFTDYFDVNEIFASKVGRLPTDDEVGQIEFAIRYYESAARGTDQNNPALKISAIQRWLANWMKSRPKKAPQPTSKSKLTPPTPPPPPPPSQLPPSQKKTPVQNFPAIWTGNVVVPIKGPSHLPPAPGDVR